MSDEDVQYFRKRAADERALARTSTGHIAEIHLDLARQYEALAEDREARLKLRINWSGQPI